MYLPPIEPVHVLAHTLHATPGSHALIIGAGVSAPAGVPSAWDVQVRLIQKLARQAKLEKVLDNDTAHPWFKDRYGVEGTYETIIEKLAPTVQERQALLRPFFEGDPADPETRPRPTSAHRSIARLALLGAVRIIITLNFDRLIETALREAGLEPVVASSVSEIQSLPPLHSIPVLVVHLHGDYLEATTMRNTLTELGTYPKKVRRFLRRLFDDYGVIVAGWSAEYDPALVKPILSSRPRFTTYIIEPKKTLKARAEQLRRRRGAVHIQLPADDAFDQLADAVTALADVRARDPLGAQAAVSIVKRHRTGQVVSANVHDTLHSELTRLQDSPELNLTSAPVEEHELLLARVKESASVPAAMLAAITYWGNATTDGWWLTRLDSFAFPPAINPLIPTDAAQLHLAAGALLFHAAGMGALAAGRHALLANLLLVRMVIGDDDERPAAAVFAPHSSIAVETPSAWLFDELRPVFADYLGLGERRYRDVWEVFEFLRLLGELWRNQATPDLLADVVDRSHATTAPLSLDTGYIYGLPSTHQVDAAAAAAHAEQELEKARGALARALHLGSRRPHLRARATPGAHPLWGAAVLRQALREANNEAWLTPLSTWHSRGQGTEALRVLAQGVSDSVGITADQVAPRTPLPGSGSMPSHLWLDTGERIEA